MSASPTPARSPRPLLTAVEAAVLVLAAFFFVSWGLLSWWSALYLW